MAGTISPGQTLTPNNNVLAAAGMGGDVWGANGGGAVAVGGGATDQTGYVKPIAITVCNGELATNFLPLPPSTQQYNTVIAREGIGLLTAANFALQLGTTGTNAG